MEDRHTVEVLHRSGSEDRLPVVAVIVAACYMVVLQGQGVDPVHTSRIDSVRQSEGGKTSHSPVGGVHSHSVREDYVGADDGGSLPPVHQSSLKLPTNTDTPTSLSGGEEHQTCKARRLFE